VSTSSHQTDRSTRLTRAIAHVTGWLGSFPAILLSVGLVVLWLIGAFFVQRGFSNNTYQLLINTGTTIITFLMVFIIQNTQNRDGRAMQAKLDAQSEVLRAIAERVGVEDDEELPTRLVGVEEAPENDIKEEQEEVRRAALSP
jgi:low affinity Fe/Cu permease